MTTDVLIATLSSIAGLIVALIALYKALHIARLQVQLHKDTEASKATIEIMKMQTQWAQAAFETANKQPEPIRTVLHRTWSALQKLKYALDLLRLTDRADEQRAVNALNGATQERQTLYETYGPVFPNAVRPAIHSAKNQTISPHAGILLRLNEAPAGKPLPTASLSWIEVQRRFFSEIQTSAHEASERAQDEVLERLIDYLSGRSATQQPMVNIKKAS